MKVLLEEVLKSLDILDNQLFGSYQVILLSSSPLNQEATPPPSPENIGAPAMDPPEPAAPDAASTNWDPLVAAAGIKGVGGRRFGDHEQLCMVVSSGGCVGTFQEQERFSDAGAGGLSKRPLDLYRIE